MNLKVAIVTQNDFFMEQMKQLMQDIDICFVNKNDDPDIIVTDGTDMSVYNISEDEIKTIFSIVEEKPQDISETPQCRFYKHGQVDINQFVSDLKCWDSVYETIRYLNGYASALSESLDDVNTQLNEHKLLMNQATEWQKKAMMPDIGNEFSCALRYRSALFASGDFVCTKNFEESSFFVIGDVSGHGISDAMVGASFKGNIDTYIEMAGPDTKITDLVQYMQKHKDCFYEKNFPEEEVFPYSVHMLVAKLDKRNYVMELCSVGYGDAPPIFISGNNVQIYKEVDSNVIPPIGEYDLPPIATKVPFHPGDGLILCSDGYTEAFIAKNKQDKQYEYKPKRLAEAARRAVLHNINWNPEDVASEIDADLHHYTLSSLSEGQRMSHDDATLLVVKWQI